MKRALCILAAAAALAANSFAAPAPLATTFADLHLDIMTSNPPRQIPHLGAQAAPVRDGVIGANEYTWQVFVQNNGQNHGTESNGGIDGWGDCNIVAGTNLTDGAPSSAADLSFTLYLAHDDTNIYMGIRIIDDILHNQFTTAVWRNDAVEFSIDGDDSRDGQRQNTATGDRSGIAGGRIDFGAFIADGDETTQDVHITNASAASFGPTFTLWDGTIGRVLGVQTYQGDVKNYNDDPPDPNPLTDLRFRMVCDNPALNGNRTLEVLIPKSSLSYTRQATEPLPTFTGKPGGVFTNDIIGLQVGLDDNDSADDTRDHQMFLENAAENILGTENIVNVNGSVFNTIAARGGANFDNVGPITGSLDQNAHAFEAAWPRFRLLPAADVQDWKEF